MKKKVEDIHKRHSVLKEIISTDEIFNQTQLVKSLKQKGIKSTQATLSRDLSELGVVRVPTANGLVYKLSATGDEITLKYRVAEEIISIHKNETLIVIKTYPGRAQGVAVFLDRQSDIGILGTIGGDDTIIVIPQSIKKIKKIIEQIKITLGIN
ncbi:MAG: arginine repressor [Ignavibacteriae bacterium HGW-Ignavibacteriae-3]|nr:MAG: arginine repressor [Ignavibacteriae bacterium HGW-Ignavibacteriae-3]